MHGSRRLWVVLAAFLCGTAAGVVRADPTPEQAREALRRAIDYYVNHVGTEGGYLYRYSADLSLREGEEVASPTMVWVQPPGTPAVGLALLHAYEATGEPAYLAAAQRAAQALVNGQLESGGWDYSIEFDPEKRRKIAYRVSPRAERGGRNTTTLDDDNTQAALRFLMRFDQATQFSQAAIHEAALYALDRIVGAQYPNGAWPQRFDAPPDAAQFPVRAASFPETWPRTWPHAAYKGHYTFNDNAIADVIDVLFEAARTYSAPRYRDAAQRAGAFILLAQMPDPQPAWAQQYDAEMHPAWARKFEPPAISGGESQSILLSLLRLYDETGDAQFLKAVPRALEYLEHSRLPDGRLARFYALKTNRPLYFTRQYELIYEPNDLPTHYAFVVASRLERIRAEYQKRVARGPIAPAGTPRRSAGKPSATVLARAQRAIERLDDRGRWIENLRFQKGGAKPQPGISSATFIQNVEALAALVEASGKAP